MRISEIITESRAPGKKMGHDLYVHKDYVTQTNIPLDAFKQATAHLPPGFDYTAVKYNAKEQTFSFISSPDFDTADEPTVGQSIKVFPDGQVKTNNPPRDPLIWHNKWMWVGDDYPGFDVEQSKQRSQHWKNIVGVNREVSSRIGRKSYWDREIVPQLKEQVVDEAISLTKYEEDLRQSVRNGIIAGIMLLEKPFITNDALLQVLDDDEASDRYVRAFMEGKCYAALEKGIAKTLSLTLNAILGKGALGKFRFGAMKNMGGFVQGDKMVINRNLLIRMSRTVTNHISSYVYDNYDMGSRAKGIRFMFTALKSQDRYTVNAMLDGTGDFVDRIISIVLHEAVHLSQHVPQAHRPNGKTEYRSYLDKSKNEFHKLANTKVSAKNKDRYYDLYYSSPQEITAFAHQMALDVIKAYDLTNVDKLQDIPNIAGEDIIYNVNQRLNNRFAQPRNPQEVAVRRRYIKQVYQEVDRYVDHLKMLLDPNRGVPKNT